MSAPGGLWRSSGVFTRVPEALVAPRGREPQTSCALCLAGRRLLGARTSEVPHFPQLTVLALD